MENSRYAKQLIKALDHWTGQDQKNWGRHFSLYLLYFSPTPAPPGRADTDWRSVRNRFSLGRQWSPVCAAQETLPWPGLMPLTTVRDNNSQLPSLHLSISASHLITPALNSSHECLEDWADWGGHLVKYSLVHFQWSTIDFSCFHLSFDNKIANANICSTFKYQHPEGSCRVFVLRTVCAECCVSSIRVSTSNF